MYTENNISTIEYLLKEKSNLLMQLDKYDILNNADALIDAMNKKILKEMERRVLEVHSNTISTLKIKDNTTGEVVLKYTTRINKKAGPRFNSRAKLIEYLFNYYYPGVVIEDDTKYRISEVFKKALAEKERNENPSNATIRKNKYDYDRFIPDSLRTSDIRTVDECAIKEFIQVYVRTNHPKKKNFLALKGILNLIFSYAYSHKYIPSNPLLLVNNKAYLKSCDTSKAKAKDKIHSVADIERIVNEVRRRIETAKQFEAYADGYALLLSIETGMRAGELCALKWEDIDDYNIHIHAMQTLEIIDKTPDRNSRMNYLYTPYTKDEKGDSNDGRLFPATDKIKKLLSEYKLYLNNAGISSDFIFCDSKGEWLKVCNYERYVRRVCRSLDLKVTNNHAFRMSLNSNVLLPGGLSSGTRAALLGHSIQTNIANYSYSRIDYLDEARTVLNAYG